MRELDYCVMGHVFETHSELGRLADESVYQHKLLHLLLKAGVEAAIEVPIELSFHDFIVPLAMDLVVERRVIYELKAVAALLPVHESQLLGYLFLTNTTHGKLINFRAKSVESKFINSTFTSHDRQQIEFNLTQYRGENSLPELITELVSDWGTGLNASLYRRAILHCCGTEPEPEQLLPMTSGQKQIGNQRFHLLDTQTALGVTTFSHVVEDNRMALRKLLLASPLEKIHWLNLSHRLLTLTTVTRN
jgi:GxxExxY protein